MIHFIGARESSGLEIGDHAVSEQIIPCWDCRYCKNGNYNFCEFNDNEIFGILLTDTTIYLFTDTIN